MVLCCDNSPPVEGWTAQPDGVVCRSAAPIEVKRHEELTHLQQGDGGQTADALMEREPWENGKKKAGIKTIPTSQSIKRTTTYLPFKPFSTCV